MVLRTARGKHCVFGILMILAGGCARDAPPVFTKWHEPLSPYVASAGSNNAYDGYVLAAQHAVEGDEAGIRRVFFTPGQREASLKRMSKSLTTFRQAVRNPCDFEYRPTGVQDLNPYLPAWRHIGRCLVWRLEAALDTQSTGEIESLTAQITRFAMDLQEGGAMEADLGLALLDESRRVLSPNLDRLNPALLSSLADLLQSATDREDALGKMIENERKNMLAGVQFVQDGFTSQNPSDLQKRLGPEVRDAVEYFKTLRKQSGAKQMAYFAGFAREIDDEVNFIRANGAKPMKDWETLEFPESSFRPWKRFSKQLFRTMRPVMERRVATQARTRLLILEMRVISQIKRSGVAPLDLSGFPSKVTLDPVTGKLFSYEADGPAYKLYSPGPDFIDNGGKSVDGTSPDLTIERDR